LFRATRQSPGGLAIVALPSSSSRLAQSRIVERCAVVTSTQSDVDIIVTEHGAADIRGTTLAERRELIAAIAPPEVRESLRRAGT
jgi:acetyl-CoA hydrolase